MKQFGTVTDIPLEIVVSKRKDGPPNFISRSENKVVYQNTNTGKQRK